MIDLLAIMLFMLYTLPVLVLINNLANAHVYFQRFVTLYSLVLILLMIYCLGINPSMNSPY